MFDRGTPVTPYGGGTAWSGSATSRDRATSEDETGVTAYRQARTLDMLDIVGPTGLTYKELGHRLGLHHGQSSGVLSTLHKAGLITRLSTKDAAGNPIPGTIRDGCSIYVTPGHVEGRPTDAQGRSTPSAIERDLAEANGEVERLGNDLVEARRRLAEARDMVTMADAVRGADLEAISELRELNEQLQMSNSALRLRLGLAMLDPEEVAFLDTVAERLASKALADGDKSIRVYLRTLRRLWLMAERLRPHRADSGTPAPESGRNDDESPES